MDATIKALESFPANIHLILGGKDKGSDYTVLNDLLRERVKRVYTIGAAAGKIESQITGVRSSRIAETLETPVRQAMRSAQAGRRGAAGSGMRQLRPVSRATSIAGRVFKEAVQAMAKSS